ncbi:MAG: COG4223 family protein, partial [Hyphomicrobiaceae bacterium]
QRAVARGTPFAADLAELSNVAGSKLDLSALERYKNSGVPSTVELTREFHNTANAIIDADSQTKDASWTDRLLAGAKSIVKVRRVDAPADDNSAEAIVARMEKSLKSERLGDVLIEAAKLSPKAAQPARGWLDKIGARAAVERAMARIEDDLKQSLGAGSGGGKKG